MKNTILTKENILFKKDTSIFKSLLINISKDFKVDNFDTINDLDCIEIDFPIKIPSNHSSYIFPKFIIEMNLEYTNKYNFINTLYWMGLNLRSDFQEDIKLFNNIADKINEFEGLDLLDSDEFQLLFKTITRQTFKEFSNKFKIKYKVSLDEYYYKCYLKNNNSEIDNIEVENDNAFNKYKYKQLHKKFSKNNTNRKEQKVIHYLQTQYPLYDALKDDNYYIEFSPLLLSTEIINRLKYIVKEYDEQHLNLHKLFDIFMLDVESYIDENDNTNHEINHLKITQFVKQICIIIDIKQYYNLETIKTSIEYYNFHLLKAYYQDIILDEINLLSHLEEDTYNTLAGIFTLEKNLSKFIIKDSNISAINKNISIIQSYIS